MNPFNAIPFFRLLIPYVLGILLAFELKINCPPIVLLLLLTVIAVASTKTSALRRRWTLFFCDLFLVAAGLVNLNLVMQNPNKVLYTQFLESKKSQLIMANICEVPVQREKSLKCELEIMAISMGDSLCKCEGKLMAYFQNSGRLHELVAGEVICFSAQLTDVAAPKNPFEFDYKRYLNKRGIQKMVYIDSNRKFIMLPQLKKTSIWNLGLQLKSEMLKRLKNSDLSDEAYAICAALLTGFDDDIDKDIVSAFSHSGTLHVLSVSGLHTGLIYACLHYLFGLIDRKKKYKITEMLFISIILWLFALITGFAAPVLRAVIMFNLLSIGKLFFRNTIRNQLNILSVSAFIILFWDPILIMDVGFLLSYGAMFGLIYLQPGIGTFFHIENKGLHYLGNSISASFSATISTLPITLFVFKQMPLWFAICNLVVVPATFILLLMAFLVLAGAKFLAVPINLLTEFLIWFIELFNREGFGFIEGIDFRFSDVVFLSVLMVLFSITIVTHSPKLVMYSLFCLITWQIFNLFESVKSKTSSAMALFSIRKGAATLIKQKQNCYLMETDSIKRNYSIRPFLINQNYPKLQLSSWNCVEQGADTWFWLNKADSIPSTKRERIKVLILSQAFQLKQSILPLFPALKLVVLDGTNKPKQIRATRELCRNFALPFYSLPDSGALLYKAEMGHYEIENWR